MTAARNRIARRRSGGLSAIPILATAKADDHSRQNAAIKNGSGMGCDWDGSATFEVCMVEFLYWHRK
jgi:hypothetical protein